jgi:CDP-diacylglycerol---glycerol-3-phosphate 3-phosphatidyltransferase
MTWPASHDAVAVLVFVGAAVISMAAYAWSGAGRDKAHVAKGTHLFLGIGDFLIHWLIWMLEPAITLSMRFGITPDQHTYIATAIGLVSAFAMASGHLALGGWTLALNGIIDTLDGHLARRTGQSSLRGDFIDGTLDRFIDVGTCLGLLVYFRHVTWGPLIAASAMGGSLIVSYARARGEVQGVNCHGGLMQRPERVVLLSVACVFDQLVSPHFLWPPGTLVLAALLLMAVTTLVTAVHRTIWIAARLH